MKRVWILSTILLSPPALALEAPKPVHSCVNGVYAIRILHTGPAADRLEIHGADLSLLVFPARPLVPHRDKLHFPAGKPRFECASISPDGSDYQETIRVYDRYVQVLRAAPTRLFQPVQYEIR